MLTMGGNKMNKISFSQFILRILWLSLIIFFTECRTATFAQTDPLSTQERALIKKCGLICVASNYVTVDIDMTIKTGPYYNSGPYYSAMLDLASGAVSGFQAGYNLGRIKAAIEAKESRKFSKHFSDWDIALVFRNTINELLKKDKPFEVVTLTNQLSRKEIKKKREIFAKEGLDAIICIHVKKYGIELQQNGFAVFINTAFEIISVDKGKRIGSYTFIYDYNYASDIHNTNKRIYSGAKEYLNHELTINSLLFSPMEVTSFDRFLENRAMLLKRELKLGALSSSRELLSLFGFYPRDNSWREDYIKKLFKN